MMVNYNLLFICCDTLYIYQFIVSQVDLDVVSGFAESEIYLPRGSNTTLKRKRRRGRETFKCYFCIKPQSCMAKLEIHLQLHTKEIIPLNCPTCGKSFRLKCTLKNHISVIHGTVEEKQRRKLNKKLTYQRNTKIISCYFCKREMRLTTLPSHMRQTHTMETFLRRCERCQKQFACLRTLREHKRRVCFPDKKYKERMRRKDLAAKARDQVNANCYFCSKKFLSKDTLENHVRGHTFEAHFYECEICKKAFLRKDVLRRHELEGCNKVQSSTKPQKPCKQCGQLVTSFKNHRYTCGVGVDNRKTCQVCNASFSRVMDKYLHTKTVHGKGKIFKCYFCSKIFLVNSLLDKHMRSHTQEKSFKCQHKNCGMFLCSSYALKIHTATQHGKSHSKNRFQ